MKLASHIYPRLILSILILSGAALVSAQPPPSAANEIQQLIDRSRQLSASEPDSAAFLATRAIRLAQSKNLPQQHVDALINMGYAYNIWDRLDSAETVLRTALSLGREIDYVRGVASALNRLGNVLWLREEQAESRVCYEEALIIFTRLNDRKEMGRTLNNLATIYREWSDYERAIELYIEAQKHYAEADYAEGSAWLDFSMTILHKKLEDYDSALKTINSALKTYETLAAQDGNSAGVAICYGQLGDIYNLMEQPEKGLDYHLRALRLREQTGVKPAISDGLSGVGTSYYSMGEYERALEYFQRSQTVRRETGAQRGMATNFKYIGSIYRELGRYPEALQSFTRGLEVTRALQGRDGESEFLLMIAELHADQNDYERAWQFLRQHQEVQAGVMNTEISKRITSMQMQHRVEEQMAENESLQSENRIKDLQLERSRTRFTLTVTVAVFALFGVVALAYMHHKRRQVKTLTGLIPICAHCKNIRNDGGYYEQLEKYISSHSDAQFSHGICPDCAQDLYGEFLKNTDLKN